MRVPVAAVLAGYLALMGTTVALAAPATGAPASLPPVKTDAGLLQGVAEDGLAVYRGVPFAAPPLGPLRWREPQPVAAWEGVRKAGTFAPRCPQIGAYPPDSPPEPMSEDCLHLNLWVPARGAAGSPLPVMVWLHGGGLATGSASLPLYAGDQLAAHGVIVVTVSYRLGVLGYLAHPELSRASPRRASGNYGFLDQIAALEWVHRNIAAFGGDPGQVTVFGQSSGSIALSALTVSPLARKLFQRAIGESGGLFEPLALAPGYTPQGADEEGVAFARKAGAADLQALRAMPVGQLLKVPFGPHLVIDGAALKEPPYDAYVRGTQIDVDLLLGYNTTEGEYFLADRPVNRSNYVSTLSEDFPPLLVHLLAPRAGALDAIARRNAVSFETDMRFRWDMWTWARLAARTGNRHVYVYRFERAPPFPADSRHAGMGPAHGMEMPYVFGHLEPAAAAWIEADRQLSSAMQTYWTSFARTGNPNAPGLPAWSSWPAPQEEVMQLGPRTGMQPIENPEALRRIDRLYRTARTIAAHPIAAAVLTGSGVIALAAAAILAWRRRRRTLHVQAA